MGEYGHVHQTFEEFATMHIDGLYRGALFLQGGDESTAEDLVLWTMTGAFKQFKRIEPGSATEQCLEGKLVEAFLARAGVDLAADDSVPVFSGDDPSFAEQETLTPLDIDPEALFRAAAKLPHVARAAIWLVLFRRWRYEEASGALKTDMAGLNALLRGRQVLLTAVVQRSEDRNGTDHDRRQ
jgi:DNA-directed RNA polymerase specialized sigma24 family protein